MNKSKLKKFNEYLGKCDPSSFVYSAFIKDFPGGESMEGRISNPCNLIPLGVGEGVISEPNWPLDVITTKAARKPLQPWELAASVFELPWPIAFCLFSPFMQPFLSEHMRILDLSSGPEDVMEVISELIWLVDNGHCKV